MVESFLLDTVRHISSYSKSITKKAGLFFDPALI